MLKYFKESEFDSIDEPGSGKLMQPEFLVMIDYARSIAGIPFVINSGFRTVRHNALVGGKNDSSHLKGLAADIQCKDSRQRFIIIDALLDAGFVRIGVAKTFIHVDLDTEKDELVVWVY